MKTFDFDTYVRTYLAFDMYQYIITIGHVLYGSKLITL